MAFFFFLIFSLFHAKLSQDHKPIRLGLTRHPDFCQWGLSIAVFLLPYCPYLEEMAPYAQLYLHICTNVLLSVNVLVLSPALVLSLSKGRDKYLSEIICWRQAYCLQGIRVPFWGASVLCCWLIPCILFEAEGLKARKPQKLENLSLNIYSQKFLLFYRVHLCIHGNCNCVA